eukprot:CAMPEP_0194069624 /NCGR_PEP_ID=MMETSP0009_2-20130614/87743_1 /TAXON_ID=210454 /ORGANISM="Grammatophora oceanica, Strain CCMP 410" /LENGTH=389 /DNA_ID=CAMNT_0038722829 /DNA_START=80 /DNA_END=1249 /DNA_ORIENTATION=+
MILDGHPHHQEASSSEVSTTNNNNHEQPQRQIQEFFLLGGAAILTSQVLPNPAAAAVVTASSIAARIIIAAKPRALSPSILARWAFCFGTMMALVHASPSLLKSLCAFGKTSMAWYLLQLDQAPLLTKSTTSALLGIAGDYMAQWLEYKLRARRQHQQQQPSNTAKRRKNNHVSATATTTPSRLVDRVKSKLRINDTYDLNRSLAIAAESLIISGPLMHFGYDYFERLLPIAGSTTKNGGGSIAAFSHVLADSILLDSIFVATAILFTGWFEGYHWRKDILPQFRQDYWTTLKTSFATSMGLLPIEFLCFRFLPVALRTLSVNVLDILWDFVVSFMTHRRRTPLRNRRQQQEEATTTTRPKLQGVVKRGGAGGDPVRVPKTISAVVGSF